jgi:hypothetical protein
VTTLLSPRPPVLPPEDNGHPRWFSKRVIPSCHAANGPLLTRYHLIATRLFGVYLHHLHVSDEDRALHDHPWSFVTVLLSSGYWEWTQERESAYTGELRVVGRAVLRRSWRPRFSVLCRPAEWAHRLELVRPTWTLVFRWRVRRHWGFFTARDGWVPWRDYTREYCD